jgi:hypothetical protein
MGNVLKLQEWGIETADMPPAKQAKILSLLDQIETNGRNWERHKWLLQTILPAHFGDPSGGEVGGVAVNNTIKFTVEEHAALKADYKQLSERAERLLNTEAQQSGHPLVNMRASINGKTHQ